jgi:hypothetical protein
MHHSPAFPEITVAFSHIDTPPNLNYSPGNLRVLVLDSLFHFFSEVEVVSPRRQRWFLKSFVFLLLGPAGIYFFSF